MVVELLVRGGDGWVVGVRCLVKYVNVISGGKSRVCGCLAASRTTASVTRQRQSTYPSPVLDLHLFCFLHRVLHLSFVSELVSNTFHRYSIVVHLNHEIQSCSGRWRCARRFRGGWCSSDQAREGPYQPTIGMHLFAAYYPPDLTINSKQQILATMSKLSATSIARSSWATATARTSFGTPRSTHRRDHMMYPSRTSSMLSVRMD